ncbi:hypothetical protein [Brevibacterium sp. VCM10]|uniref:hypothetical protein n=1 Tax=Brevibacterium sp. VCM10 TaxID=1381751 RepID=UPI0004AD45A6|nr:hypothetical protein [Brevibacterium sp. VCM10]
MAKLRKAKLPDAPAVPLTVPADLTRYRQKFGALRILVLAGLIAVAFFSFGVETVLVCIVVAFVFVVAGLIGMKSSRIVFTGSGVEYRNWYGRSITLGRDDIEGVIVFTDFHDASFGRALRISIARRAFKSAISLNGLYWPADQLLGGVSVMEDHGISVKQCDDRLNFVEVAKRFPKHSTFLERNWVKVGLGIAFFGVIVPSAIALVHDAIV